ncbi:MAG: hypothetical protein ACFCU1_12665 [Sumerlaeia bacterium]
MRMISLVLGIILVVYHQKISAQTTEQSGRERPSEQTTSQNLKLDDIFTSSLESAAGEVEPEFQDYIAGAAPFIYPNLSRFTLQSAQPAQSVLSPETEAKYSEIDRSKLGALITKPKNRINTSTLNLVKTTATGAQQPPASRAWILLSNSMSTVEVSIRVENGVDEKTETRLSLFPGEQETIELATASTMIHAEYWFSAEPEEVFTASYGPYELQSSTYTFEMGKALESQLLRQAP